MKRKKLIKGIGAVVFLVVSFAVWSWINLTDPEFTQEKWISHPEKRIMIVDDYLAKNRLIGMTQNEIRDTLGQPDNTTENQLEYYLGEDGIGMDAMILYIEFDDEGKAIKYSINQS